MTEQGRSSIGHGTRHRIGSSGSHCDLAQGPQQVATDMADAILTRPLLAEGLNTLFAMFDGGLGCATKGRST
jgi:hypothetical protein